MNRQGGKPPPTILPRPKSVGSDLSGLSGAAAANPPLAPHISPRLQSQPQQRQAQGGPGQGIGSLEQNVKPMMLRNDEFSYPGPSYANHFDISGNHQLPTMLSDRQSLPTSAACENLSNGIKSSPAASVAAQILPGSIIASLPQQANLPANQRSAQSTPKSSPRQTTRTTPAVGTGPKRNLGNSNAMMAEKGDHGQTVNQPYGTAVPQFLGSEAYSAPPSPFGSDFNVGMFLTNNAESPLGLLNQLPVSQPNGALNLEGGDFSPKTRIKEEVDHSEGSLEEWATASFVMQESVPQNGDYSGKTIDDEYSPLHSMDSVPRVKSEEIAEDEERPGEKKKSTNSAASARFRQKKKLQDQEREQYAKAVTAKVHSLQRKILVLEAEAAYLREILRLRAINEAALDSAHTFPQPTAQMSLSPIPPRQQQQQPQQSTLRRKLEQA